MAYSCFPSSGALSCGGLPRCPGGTVCWERVGQAKEDPPLEMLCGSSPPLLAREGVVGLPVLYFGMAVSGTPLESHLLADGSQTGSVALTLMTRITGLAFGGGLSVMAGDLLWTPITSRFFCLAVPTRENKVPFFELGCLKLWA